MSDKRNPASPPESAPPISSTPAPASEHSQPVALPGRLLPPSDPRAPKYWMYEQSGVLRPAIEAYLHNRSLTIGQIALMRAYLRQWIMSPVWDGGEELEQLRESVERIKSQSDIREWLNAALREGHDPL